MKDAGMHRTTWHKKDVALTWQGRRLEFGVAQELFSSHDVDAGSRLLLRSLDPASWPEIGRMVDYGCGYGVLGLAWLQVKPEWTGVLIDRDHLAVAFAADNADRLGLERAECRVGLGVDTLPASGVDLLLWNVPGKAGEGVLRQLTVDCLEVLSSEGVLALVVVNPLAEPLREVLAADPLVSVIHDVAHADHTIIHAQRSAPPGVVVDPFARGVFDREPAGFGVDEFDYDITPVVGVPEYDSYDHATEVTFDILRTVPDGCSRALVMRPGQGHVPLVVREVFQPRQMILADRDLLALRATTRALTEVPGPPIELGALPLVDLAETAATDLDLVVICLEDQVRNEVHQARLDDLETILATGGQLVVSGGSSVVSRFLSFAAKRRGWKLRDRTKRAGASAARLERVPR